jgi:hypothetical protein
MTYSELKAVINDAYSDFTFQFVIRRTLGADWVHSNREMFFSKAIYKVLLNQDGDESVDKLTRTDIQNCITMFNKYSHSQIPQEYE